MSILATAEWLAYPSWLNAGDNAWQLTAATFVGMMSIPGSRRALWRCDAEALVGEQHDAHLRRLCARSGCVVSVGLQDGLRHADRERHGLLRHVLGKPGSVLGKAAEEGQAAIPSISSGPPFHFPQSSLVYFQFVFAGITPILMLGSVLGSSTSRRGFRSCCCGSRSCTRSTPS